MRGHSLIFVAIFSSTLVLPEVAQAQFSPGGIINGITRPFRQALRHFGHYPLHRHHRAPAAAQRIPRATPPAKAALPSNISRLGWVGPAAWPTAYEDVLGFTFAPNDYAIQLRERGFDVIANTITGRFDVSRVPTRAATTGTAVRDAADDRHDDACRNRAPAQDDWPAARIQQVTKLSDEQRQALEKVQNTVDDSVKSIRANCRDSAALTAPNRLNALVRAIWTVRDAGISVRAPVRSFYDSLTPEQQASFVIKQPQSPANVDTKPPQDQQQQQQQQYQACAPQNVGAAERMIKEIEQRVRPNKDQTASLETLHKTATDMAKLVMASCMQPLPTDPVTRLEAADSQLIALNYAATTMQIAFNDFYSRLDDGQKKRLDATGR